MILQTILLPGIIAPVVGTLAVFLVIGLIRRGRKESLPGASGLAVATGFVVAFIAISGWPRWPPVEATQRICFLVAALGLLSPLWARIRRTRTRIAVQALLLSVLLGLTLQAMIRHTWGDRETVLWLAGLLVIGTALGWSIDRNLARPGGSILGPAVRITVLSAIAVTLALSETFRLAQLTGALTCSVGLTDLLAARRSRVAWVPSDAIVLTTALGGMLLVGYFYAGLESWTGVLLGASVLLLGTANSGSLWKSLTPLLPAAIALFLAIGAFLRPAEDPYDYYSYVVSEPASSAILQR